MKINYAMIVRLSKQGMKPNPIAKLLSCKWETVDRTVKKCKEIYGDLRLVPDDITSEQLDKVINKMEYAPNTKFLQPDCEVLLEKQKNSKISRNELYDDYCREAKEQGLEAYKISRFNEKLSQFYYNNDLTFSLDKTPGVECQVDWVGDKPLIPDDDNGGKIELHIFVMALPYSGYFYCEAFLNERMSSWLEGHRHAFEFFGGCPAMVVPDNCKTATKVARRHYYEKAVLNPTYHEFLKHYNMVAEPAMIYSPTQKSCVERSVGIFETDIMPKLDRLEIRSLDEYNRLLHRKLITRLAKKFTRKFGSRTEIFFDEEKPLLLHLPTVPSDLYREREAIANSQLLVQYEKAFYSIPYTYVKKHGRTVTVRDMGNEVNIIGCNGQVIATHKKATKEGQKVKEMSHYPDSKVELDGPSWQKYHNKAQKLGGVGLDEWVSMMEKRNSNIVYVYATMKAVMEGVEKYAPNIVSEAAHQAAYAQVTDAKDFLLLVKSFDDRYSLDVYETKQESLDYSSIYYTHNYEEENDENR